MERRWTRPTCCWPGRRTRAPEHEGLRPGQSTSTRTRGSSRATFPATSSTSMASAATASSWSPRRRSSATDGRSITLSLRQVLRRLGVGLRRRPAGPRRRGQGLGDCKEHQAAKDAMVEAVTSRDRAAAGEDLPVLEHRFQLHRACRRIANWWSATGPYVLSGLVANDHATLTANPHYVGDHRPQLRKGDRQVHLRPARRRRALRGRRGRRDRAAVDRGCREGAAVGARTSPCCSGFDGAYEHLDLQFDNGKKRRVRQSARARGVPQRGAAAADPRALVIPLQEDAAAAARRRSSCRGRTATRRRSR